MTKNKNTIFKDIDDDEILDFIKKYEDTKYHMYLDTLGNVTVGTGRMLPNKDAARRLPFYIYEKTPDERYSTRSETGEAYDRVKKRRFGQSIGASRFDPNRETDLFKINLKKEDADKILKEDIIRSVDELREKFDNFDSYPKSARKALVDMQFNLGDTKFREEYYDPTIKDYRKGWPNLMDAVKNKRWTDAATQSRRKNVGADRNKEIEGLFMRSRHE